MMKEINIPIKKVCLDDDNYHIVIKSEMAENNSCWWIIDTGASKTVFDICNVQMYENLGSIPKTDCKSTGINGEIENVCVGRLFDLKFSCCDFSGLEVALVDLSHVNKVYNAIVGYNIVGLIGGDFLDKYSAVIDYGKERLTISL